MAEPILLFFGVGLQRVVLVQRGARHHDGSEAYVARVVGRGDTVWDHTIFQQIAANHLGSLKTGNPCEPYEYIDMELEGK